MPSSLKSIPDKNFPSQKNLDSSKSEYSDSSEKESVIFVAETQRDSPIKNNSSEDDSLLDFDIKKKKSIKCDNPNRKKNVEVAKFVKPREKSELIKNVPISALEMIIEDCFKKHGITNKEYTQWIENIQTQLFKVQNESLETIKALEIDKVNLVNKVHEYAKKFKEKIDEIKDLKKEIRSKATQKDANEKLKVAKLEIKIHELTDKNNKLKGKDGGLTDLENALYLEKEKHRIAVENLSLQLKIKEDQVNDLKREVLSKNEMIKTKDAKIDKVNEDYRKYQRIMNVEGVKSDTRILLNNSRVSEKKKKDDRAEEELETKREKHRKQLANAVNARDYKFQNRAVDMVTNFQRHNFSNTITSQTDPNLMYYGNSNHHFHGQQDLRQDLYSPYSPIQRQYNSNVMRGFLHNPVTPQRQHTDDQYTAVPVSQKIIIDIEKDDHGGELSDTGTQNTDRKHVSVSKRNRRLQNKSLLNDIMDESSTDSTTYPNDVPENLEEKSTKKRGRPKRTLE